MSGVDLVGIGISNDNCVKMVFSAQVCVICVCIKLSLRNDAESTNSRYIVLLDDAHNGRH